MNYIALVIGIVLAILGVVSLDLLIVGIGIIIISFFLPAFKFREKDKSKKTSIVQKLDQVKFESLHEDALSNAISDTVAVTAKIAQGKQPEVNTKTIVKGTLNVVEGVNKIVK
jgi:hypothetical protein